MAEDAQSSRPDTTPEQARSGSPVLDYHRAHSYELPRRWSAWDYVWFILKNILGWVLMLASMPIGMTVPGPGGIPIFLIGFALITFPGKRKLTASVLRGLPVNRESKAYKWTVAAVAILAPAAVISWVWGRWFPFFLEEQKAFVASLLGILYFCCVIAIWSFGLRGVRLINLFLRGVPMVRRKVRPWLRKKGLDLLPPRRRRRRMYPGQPDTREPDEGILEIHERHQHRLREFWKTARPWLILLLRLSVIVAIFAWMARPIVREWPRVRERIFDMNGSHFAVAALMFAVFLFAFRAMVWRRILAGMGYRLPIATSVRIWSMSELARYIPGVIWQVVGRVYLTKPHGIPASVTSASQFLELAIFMLSNILVGLTCLLAAGFRRIPPDDRKWLWIAAAFVPVLFAFLVPRVFYGLLNTVMGRIGQPEITQRLPKRWITVLVLWTILGLLWQSLALWLLTSSILHLPIEKWYVLAGAYCIAWTIGFSVGFLAPAGMGPRELVFIALLAFALPRHLIESRYEGDMTLFKAFLGFVGFLLRLWTIAGELTLAAIAYLASRKAPGMPAQQPPLGEPLAMLDKNR